MGVGYHCNSVNNSCKLKLDNWHKRPNNIPPAIAIAQFNATNSPPRVLLLWRALEAFGGRERERQCNTNVLCVVFGEMLQWFYYKLKLSQRWFTTELCKLKYYYCCCHIPQPNRFVCFYAFSDATPTIEKRKVTWTADRSWRWRTWKNNSTQRRWSITDKSTTQPRTKVSQLLNDLWGIVIFLRQIGPVPWIKFIALMIVLNFR